VVAAKYGDHDSAIHIDAVGTIITDRPPQLPDPTARR
jgi:hypothetical protein